MMPDADVGLCFRSHSPTYAKAVHQMRARVTVRQRNPVKYRNLSNKSLARMRTLCRQESQYHFSGN